MPRLRLHFADLQTPVDFEGSVDLDHPFKDHGEFAILEGYQRTILFHPQHLRCIEWLNEDIVDEELAREAERRMSDPANQERIPWEQIKAEHGLGDDGAIEGPGKD